MFFKVRDKCDLLCGRGLEAGQGWKGQWLKMIRGLNGVEMIEKFFFFFGGDCKSEITMEV